MLPERSSALRKILDLARWAPSGDNTQPWRFEIAAADRFIIHGRDTRDHCVYDLHGHASQLALGTLLETIAIAASDQGLEAWFQRNTQADPARPTFLVQLRPMARRASDSLLPFVKQRTTQRRSMSMRSLTADQMRKLEAAVSPSFQVRWLNGWANRVRMAGLLFHNAHIRLTTYEAFLVHRGIIQWRARYSKDRIPEQALGSDPLATRLMQWCLRSWGRVRFMNRYMAGTWLPRLQLDVMPALRCATHFVLVAAQAPQDVDGQVAAGRALQRFWLTATSLGLQLQPEMTPLIFASYVRQNTAFTTSPKPLREAKRLAASLERLLGAECVNHAVFLGRLGNGPTARSRSLRLPLMRLVAPPNADASLASPAMESHAR